MRESSTVRRVRSMFASGFVVGCTWVAPASSTAQAPEAQQPSTSPAKKTNGDRVQQVLNKALSQFEALQEGKNADYIPALARVNPSLYGLTIVTVEGRVYEAGDTRKTFSIQSAAKPFVLARTMTDAGPDEVQKRIGVVQTGQPFNSILAIELLEDQKRPPAGNPLVNAGAIATVDMLRAGNGSKWQAIEDILNGFAGRLLEVDQTIYRSETETNSHNRAIVALLADYEVVTGDPAEALDLYTRECSVGVTARDLATMGATLANGGRNPLTDQQVVSSEVARRVLAVMATTGLYETTGDWLFDVGVPAKSGVGGGIVAVVPGRYAIGTFSPPLDEAGNSVRGQRAIAMIVEQLGGNIFEGQSSATALGARKTNGPRHAAAERKLPANARAERSASDR
jgi:glutaminase